jgi:serine/threonine-protein kinase
MGVVYRATQLALGRPVAVKAIAPELVEEASYRERFKRESQLAASIDHPNIIPVYEAGESDEALYLIMRWVEGTDLRAMLIASGRLAPKRAVLLLRPVASALAAAHQQGLVHRDVKPANVLVARGDDQDEEHVYLTDFGIARRTAGQSAMTGTGLFVGTVDYMAPERILGGKGDSATDTYSFGCMLFETLTGQLPFDRPTNVAKVFAHVNDPVPSVRSIAPAVPEWLDAIVTKAMAKRPEDRFASAGLLTRALGEALEDLNAREHAIAAPTSHSPAPAAPSEATTVPTGTPSQPSEPREPVRRVATTAEQRAAPPTRLAATPPIENGPAAPAQRRRRTALWAAAVALLVGIGVVAALIATGGSSSPPASSQLGNGSTHPSSEVTAISSGLSQLQVTGLGSAPGGLAVTQGGDVWVSLPATGTAVRMASTGARTRFAVGGRPSLVAAGPAGIWLSNSSSGALALFDAQTGRPIAHSPLTSPPTALATDPGDGSAWAADSTGAVVHIDPSGSLAGQQAQIPPPVLGLGWGEGWLWALKGEAGGLVRISLGGDGSTTTFDTRPAPVSVTFDQGVWTAHSTGDVTRFDPRPGVLHINTDNRIAPSLDAINAIENEPSVWATSKQTRTLYRLSTQTGAPVTGTVRFAAAPVALAVTSSAVWVATGDGNLTAIGF